MIDPGTIEKLTQKINEQDALIERLQAEVKAAHYRERPGLLRGRTIEAMLSCGLLTLTVNEDEAGQPFEVFFQIGKGDSCQQSQFEALGIAISVALRYGADPRQFVEKFSGMRCAQGGSCLDGLAQALGSALDLGVQLPLLETPAPSDIQAGTVSAA